jgi:hypothetical protein
MSIPNRAEPLYYPTLMVALRLVFDEAMLDTDPLSAAPSEASLVNPSTANKKALGMPTFWQSDAALPEVSRILNVIPTSAQLSLPGHRDAWTWKVTFDWRDLPIDSRVVRAVGASFYLACQPASAFAEAMRASGGRKAGLIRAANVPTDDPLMIGVADEWEMEQGEDGGTVTLTGRDLKGVLLDSPVNIKAMATLDLTRPIDSVISQIMSRHPFGDQFTVSIDADEWSGGIIPAPATEDDCTRVRLPAKKKPTKGKAKPKPAAPATSDKFSFWDIITQYCYLVGAIPVFQGWELWIHPVVGLYQRRGAGLAGSKVKTPFAGGKTRTIAGESEPRSVRMLAYGRNLRTWGTSRKFGGQKPRVVEVVCLDTSSKVRGLGRLLRARWPDVSDNALKLTKGKPIIVSPSGAETQAQIMRVVVAGVTDTARLARIAQGIYEEMARGEFGGTFETDGLATLGGDNTDADLLRLRPGDCVEMEVDVRPLQRNAPLVSTFTDASRATEAQRVEELTAATGDRLLARVLVASQRATTLPRFFYIKSVDYKWGSEEGITVNAEFQNYMEEQQGGETTAPLPAEVSFAKPQVGVSTVVA